jgi:hypothetical protein
VESVWPETSCRADFARPAALCYISDMRTCTAPLFRQYLERFAVPAPADRLLIGDGTVGLVMLPESRFRYDRNVGYSFETVVMVEEESGQPVLFVRIDSWDPGYRETNPIDYCIPIADPNASERERLVSSIGFDGGWSDTKQEVIVVFDPTWRDWFRSFSAGLAFSSPGAESAAFMKYGERETPVVHAFVGTVVDAP